MTEGDVSRYIGFRFLKPTLTPIPDGVERFLIGPGLSADVIVRVAIAGQDAARTVELAYEETARNGVQSFCGYRALYDAVRGARQDIECVRLRLTSWSTIAEALADNVEHYVRCAAALLGRTSVALNGCRLDSGEKLDELDRVLALMPFGVRAKLTVANESRSDSGLYFEDTEPALPQSVISDGYRARLLECFGPAAGNRAELLKRITMVVSGLGQEQAALDLRHSPEAALPLLEKVLAPGPAHGEPAPRPAAEPVGGSPKHARPVPQRQITALVDALDGAPDQRAVLLRSFLDTARPGDRKDLVAAVGDRYGDPAAPWSALPWLLCLVGEDNRLDAHIAWKVGALVRQPPATQPGRQAPPTGPRLGADLNRMASILALLDRAVGDAEAPQEMSTVLSGLGSQIHAELDRAEEEHNRQLRQSTERLVRAEALRDLLNDEGEKPR
ncbi:hypothetical protein [Streptomyces sp. NBC_01481]|uniref:hypothetical protein n=1 Tax=Streptomyces sp. NBC_01481 TaxID=2975869 RepID=UPI002251F063|nr:hypothetical protein [Streptomyces sp. NBC_01481]MCX4585546.1 hypothetical protein [Streptomyces sp. NBC_01481]